MAATPGVVAAQLVRDAGVPSKATVMLTGEVGRYEGVRFVKASVAWRAEMAYGVVNDNFRWIATTELNRRFPQYEGRFPVTWRRE